MRQGKHSVTSVWVMIESRDVLFSVALPALAKASTYHSDRVSDVFPQTELHTDIPGVYKMLTAKE